MSRCPKGDCLPSLGYPNMWRLPRNASEVPERLGVIRLDSPRDDKKDHESMSILCNQQDNRDPEQV